MVYLKIKATGDIQTRGMFFQKRSNIKNDIYYLIFTLTSPEFNLQNIWHGKSS